MTTDLLARRWYAVEDDTVGGYAISTVDKPVSELDHNKGELMLALFLSEELADHIAQMHNWALKRGTPWAGMLQAGMVFDVGAALAIFWPDVHPRSEDDRNQWVILLMDGEVQVRRRIVARVDMDVSRPLGMLPGMESE